MLLHHHHDHHQPSARRPHLHLPLVALLVMVACHHQQQQLVAAQSQPQPQVQPQAQPQPQSQLQQEAGATQAEPLPRPESLAEPAEPAAVIKFVGMQHGHPDDERAKEELIKGLRLITKHAIKLDAMEAGNRVDRSFDVAWHSERLAECAERPLEELLATIKNPATREFTREFKMFLGENFKPPTGIEVEWRADCQNLARKRSQVPGDEPARATAADERQQQQSNTSSLFPSASRALGGDAPLGLTEDADKAPQAATEAAASSTASTTTTVEPSAPSSTAEPQPTTPDFLGSSSEPTTTTTAEEPPSGAGEVAGEAAPTGATSGLDASPKSDPFGDEFFNGSPSLFGDSNSTTSRYENIAGPLNTSILDAPPSSGASSTTTAPSLLLLSNETATTESTSASSLESVASSSEPSVTTTTTTAADLSSAGPENSTAPAELDATTTTTAQSGVKVEASSDSPGEKTTMAPMLISDELVEQAPPSRIWARQLEATAPAPKSAAAGAPEPHYGKYVGLTTAFLIFCAYLVCARAYRRQGMYELHESSSSLATRT